MAQENFDQEEISQHVAVIRLPSMANSRRMTKTFHQSQSDSIGSPQQTMKQNTPPGNTIDMLLNAGRQSNLHLEDIRKRRQNLQENLAKQKMMKEQKLETLRKEVQSNRLKDYTFKPTVNKTTDNTRTLEEFLESQQRFAQKVEDKKNLLKEMLNQTKKGETFRPKVLSVSHNMSQREPVHQRLYNQRNKQPQPSYLYDQNTFKPAITSKGKKVVRQGRVDLHLYKDALRRQQKLKQSSVPNTANIQKPALNLTNQKYVAQKFIKEYYSILQIMEIQDSAEPLQYIVFNELLYRMGFVASSRDIENKACSVERGLVYEAFRLLEKYCVNIRNICVFLLALIGIYHINPTNFDGQNSQAAEFNLTQTEGRKLQRHFDLLYRNRLFAEELKKTPGPEQYSFKPAINPESSQLAQNYRFKMLQQTTNLIQSNELVVDIPQDGMISHADLLILNKLGKQKQMEKMKDQREQQSLRECTFKPSLVGDNRGRSMMCNQQEDFYQPKYQELYNLSKVQKKPKEVSRLELEQNDQQQCTFVPKINKKKMVTPKPPENIGKDIEKSLIRMMEGRKIRQNKNKFLERGQLSKGSKIDSRYSCRDKTSFNNTHNNSHNPHYDSQKQHEQQDPFLVIDVNLGQQVEQIIVYKHEAKNPEMLAAEFAVKHKLDDSTKFKLLEMLKIEINNILQKIEQEEEQYQ